jgi:Nickel responsive protein SCO4226-like
VTSFLVEAYTPASASIAEIEARAQLAANELSRGRTPVRYVRSIYVPEDQTCFHIFESPSVEAVRVVSDLAGLSAQRIVEAFEGQGQHVRSAGASNSKEV